MPQDHIVVHRICYDCTYTVVGCVCPHYKAADELAKLGQEIENSKPAPKKRGRPRKTTPKE